MNPPPPTGYPSLPATPVADPDPHEIEENDFLRNLWLMVLERKWYAVSVFLVTVLAVGVYTFLATPIYESVATIQVLRRGAQVLRGADVVESAITSEPDFNTQIKILESVAILQQVANRLTPDELKGLLEPYRAKSGDAPGAVSVLYRNRRILPQRFTMVSVVRFTHPSPKIAARMANLIALEYITYNSRLRVDESMKAVDDLKERADQQRKRVDEVANALQAFRQKGNLISLVQSKDIVTEKLKALNMITTQASSRLKDAEVKWNLVQDYQKNGRDLTELPFIQSQTKVNQLMLQISSQKLTLAQLRERYKAKHPRLIETTNTLAQAEVEMQAALATAARSIRAEYEDAQGSDAAARAALAEQEAKSLELDKAGVEYENLDREFRVNNQLLESMLARIREASVSSSIETETARIIDRAIEATAPISPNVLMNLLAAVGGGVVLGLGVAYLVALLDDRVKTIFDVERLLGLPLLAIVPRVERLEQPDKAQVVANGADRAVAESFLSLYSTLRLKDEGRNARFVLVTSTLPGEGKSFVATNLALTFAQQGQQTIVIDCDLRKPNIQRSFRLRTNRGLVNHCVQGCPLDEVIVKQVQPNLDVITVGDRAKNPVQLLNSPAFERMLADLGRRYEHVIIDSPPLGAVSDALNILPLIDGVIYAIQFNRVKRMAVRRCVNRLLSANVPVFGAVLNDMSGAHAAEYYGEADRRSMKEYYGTRGDSVGAPAS